MTQKIYLHRYFDGQEWQEHQTWHLENGVIVEVINGPSPGTDMQITDLVIPGLIDLQVNGGGGVLLNQKCDHTALQQVADAHAHTGTTAIAATIITDHKDHWRAQLSALMTALDQGVDGIAACHLEGPWLNPKRPGTHAPEAIRTPESADFDLIAALLKRCPVLITLAPECVSISDLEWLHHHGAIVFAGHSECPPDLFALLRGTGLIAGVTHLYNAMPLGSSRAPGLAACALADAACAFGLIADGVHVGDVFLDIALGAQNAAQRAILVSDAMPPAGQHPPTSFQLYDQIIRVENHQCINQKGDFAGAALPLMDCIGYLRGRGYNWEALLPLATVNPARILNNPRYSGRLCLGATADFIQMSSIGAIKTVYRAGRPLLPNQSCAAP